MLSLLAAGGIFETTDRGRTWTHLDPAFNQQFLSVAYDPDTDTVYAGSQISGVARRIAGGPWEWINTGLGAGDLIVPQLEIDPVDGTVYLLLTGDYGTWSNRDRTGVYSRAPADASWTHLRGTVNHPPSVSQAYELWWYPTSPIVGRWRRQLAARSERAAELQRQLGDRGPQRSWQGLPHLLRGRDVVRRGSLRDEHGTRLFPHRC